MHINNTVTHKQVQTQLYLKDICGKSNQGLNTWYQRYQSYLYMYAFYILSLYMHCSVEDVCIY